MVLSMVVTSGGHVPATSNVVLTLVPSSIATIGDQNTSSSPVNLTFAVYISIGIGGRWIGSLIPRTICTYTLKSNYRLQA